MGDIYKQDDCIEDEKLKVLKRIYSKRSISLPGAAAGQVKLAERSPSCPGAAEGGWNRLGLYLKGLPPRAMRKTRKQSTISEDVSVSASAQTEMYGVKIDQETLGNRMAWQERQYNKALANMVEELQSARQGLNFIQEEKCEAANHMEEHLEVVQENIGKLIKQSLDYGKLRYEEKVSKVLDELELYAASLHHGIESIERESKELHDTIDDDKLLNQIKKTQEDMQCKPDNYIESFPSVSESNWRAANVCKTPDTIEKRKGKLSVIVQELTQRKLSSSKRKESRIEKVEVLAPNTPIVPTMMSRFRMRLSDLVDNTIDTFAYHYDDGQNLLNWLRYLLAAGLTIAAVVIALWPVVEGIYQK